MSTLMNWYPGDRALDFFLIVALGVTLLSGAAGSSRGGCRGSRRPGISSSSRP